VTDGPKGYFPLLYVLYSRSSTFRLQKLAENYNAVGTNSTPPGGPCYGAGTWLNLISHDPITVD